MIVVKPNTGTKRIMYLSREGTPAKVVLFNELVPSDITEITTGFGFDGIYAFYDLDTTILTDANYYIFKVLDSTDNVLFYGKIYSTIQEIKDFSVNKDKYIENQSNNDFITFHE